VSRSFPRSLPAPVSEPSLRADLRSRSSEPITRGEPPSRAFEREPPSRASRVSSHRNPPLSHAARTAFDRPAGPRPGPRRVVAPSAALLRPRLAAVRPRGAAPHLRAQSALRQGARRAQAGGLGAAGCGGQLPPHRLRAPSPPVSVYLVALGEILGYLCVFDVARAWLLFVVTPEGRVHTFIHTFIHSHGDDLRCCEDRSDHPPDDGLNR
jgi:hypothetical protein